VMSRQAETAAEAYQIATDFVVKATRGLSSFVLLANTERDCLQAVAGSGFQRAETLYHTIGREKGLSWQVLDSGLPRFEFSAATHPQAHLVSPINQGSYIGVPIFQEFSSQRHVIGVLTADTRSDIGGFLPEDIETMNAIASALSSTLVRLAALENAKNRATAFAKLAQLSSDLEQLEDEKKIAKRGLLTLLELTGLDVAGYMTLHGQHLRVVSSLGAALGDDESSYRAFLEQTPIGRGDVYGQVAQDRQTRLIADYHQTLFFQTSPVIEHRFRTVVICPVIVDGRVKAFIAAASVQTPRAFGDNTQELVEFIAGRLARAIERSEGVQEVLHTRAETFRTLGLALEARDFETKGHTDRVLGLAMQLGQKAGLNSQHLQALEWGALLHDIGKIAVPDHVLLKPNKLGPDEWLQIRQHPKMGFEMLQGLTFLPPETLEIVLYHQERLDGSGYPECRQAAQIPYLARLFAVVDVFDALTSERPYKPGWSQSEAVAELERQAGKTLDATLVQMFVGILKGDNG
jgi:HD-GYP domain-containing protein (c-di-GMP phosphodiesterase class II)